MLMIQAVNATAGIFAGDRLTLQATLEPGASVLLTSPSAHRIYTMPEGEATLEQRIAIQSNAWLEWMPELFIPQRDARYRQQTEMDIAAGGSMYFVETLAPGRVAHGETFAFKQLRWSTRIRHDGKLIHAEHYHLQPGNSSLHDVRVGGAARYFASALLIHPAAISFRDWQHQLNDWCKDGLIISGTMLAEQVYLFRLLTDGSERLKSALTRLRALLATAIPQLAENARKL